MLRPPLPRKRKNKKAKASPYGTGSFADNPDFSLGGFPIRFAFIQHDSMGVDPEANPCSAFKDSPRENHQKEKADADPISLSAWGSISAWAAGPDSSENHAFDTPASIRRSPLRFALSQRSSPVPSGKPFDSRRSEQDNRVPPRNRPATARASAFDAARASTCSGLAQVPGRIAG